LTFPFQSGGFYYITIDNDIGGEELIKLINLLTEKIKLNSD
jgi:hypothetical protein